MTSTETVSTAYQPDEIEPALRRWWRERRLYHVPVDHPGRPYVIMMPPPNVTAILHMGHGLNNTVQDVLIRFERMRGRAALWLPGTDHAGIATQNVVEKQLAREGRSRFDLGRGPFVERVWGFVKETGAQILEQLDAIGASCDWDRTYFTLDEDLSLAVREVFVRLYEQGLIYRGKYIINWCPRCLTALSNEEAEREDREGKLWHLKYPLADDAGEIVVATTRPETMLGDVAVVVHPDDARYQRLIGRELMLPLVNRRIPIIADAAVDPTFGSGAVKVTPAHDPVDFEIGQRHGLPQLDVMTPDARMNDSVPERFRGLDRYEARKQVVAEFEALGLLGKVEQHRSGVGTCYRCDTVVEPRLSDQWFVKMAPLAEPALRAYRDGRLSFVPEHRGEEYARWLEGIRDWCISRQLWWGHRIPVFYCDGCGKTTASRTDLVTCPDCGAPARQDEDVLDTWFSSWLVPFSSLGWPEQTADLKRFYPGDVLVTAPEILFFWVARMVMSGCRFMDDIPYHTVYLHGTVRDTQYRKMSKSLGNGIDPLEVVSRYGADALRYTIVSGMSVGTDLILDPADLEKSFAPGRNFANKLWNLGRLILGNLPEAPAPVDAVRDRLSLADRWILARLDLATREATENYERYRLNEAAAAIYHFLWSDLADWYVELIKPRLYGDEPGGDVARSVVAHAFEQALRLLHPVMPFITEALWKRMPGRDDEASISLAPWPVPGTLADDAALRDFALVQGLVGAIRQIRAEYGVQPGTAVRAMVEHASAGTRAAIEAERTTVLRLAKVSAIAFGAPDGEIGGNAVLADGTSVFVPLGDAIDLEKECARLGDEIARLEQLVATQEKKLGNENFVSRAPADVVEKERAKLVAWREQAGVLAAKRRQLGCR